MSEILPQQYDSKAEKKNCQDNKIPNLLRVGDCDTQAPDLQYIDSRHVDPVVSTTSFSRFVIPSVGFLNPNSRLIVGLNWSDTEKHYFLPTSVGISALIDRVVLKASGLELSSISGFDHFSNFNNLFMPKETVNGKQISRNGIIGAFRNGINDASIVASTWNNQTCIELDSQYETDLTNKRLFINKSLRLKDGAEYQIDIGALVPMLSGVNLPMYAIEDQLELLIYWKSGKNYVAGHAETSEVQTLTVDVNNVGLICDFVLYDQKIMDTINNNKIFPNSKEYNLFRRLLAPANDINKHTLNIGGANKYVNGVIVQLSDNSLTASNKILSLLGEYRSLAPEGYDNENRFNFSINGRDLFPSDISNSAELAGHLKNYNMFSPYINRSEYIEEGSSTSSANTLSDLSIEGRLLNTEANGNYKNKNYHYFSIERFVNESGIDMRFQRSGTTPETKSLDLRAWVCVKKTVVLNNGRFSQNYMMM